MDLVLVGAIALVGLAAILVVAGAYAAFGRSDEVLERVERLTAPAAAAPYSSAVSGPGSSSSIWSVLLAPFAKIAQPAESSEDYSRIKRKLVYAGYRGARAPELFFGAKFGLAVLLAGGLVVASAFVTQAIKHIEMIAVILAAIGFYAPNVWLGSKVTTRQRGVTLALPDTLDLLVTCVEAGLGLEAALQRITAEIKLSAPLLASELSLTINEMRAGITRSDAFRRLAERTGLEELRTLSAVLIQTEMFGTSIAKALRVHSNSMRIRRTHRAEEKAATVAVKMLLPLIFFILPSLFAVILGPAVVRIVRTLLPTLGGGQ